MPFYAAFCPKTGKFLPEVGGSGYTFSRPMLPEKMSPRLHVKKSGAQQALRYWLAGEHHVHVSRNRSGLFGEDDYVRQETRPVEGRIKEDWVIVEVFLHFDFGVWKYRI